MQSSGFTGGVQAGYNWQAGTLLYGGEADFGAFSLRKSVTSSGTFPFAFLGTGYGVTESMNADWLATFRGRMGVTITPDILLYAQVASLSRYQVHQQLSRQRDRRAVPGRHWLRQCVPVLGRLDCRWRRAMGGEQDLVDQG